MSTSNRKDKKVRRRKNEAAGSMPKLKPPDYQPSKAELEEDLSVPVTLEQLAKAAVSGGAERRGV